MVKVKPVLTPRQCDVVRLVTTGQTNDEIAKTLSLSVSSIKTYIVRIREKLGLKNKVELAVWGLQHLEVGRGRVKSH